MLMKQKKEGPVRSCLIPILTFLGFIALCFVFCFVLYTLNLSAISNTSGGFAGISIQ